MKRTFSALLILFLLTACLPTRTPSPDAGSSFQQDNSSSPSDQTVLTLPQTNDFLPPVSKSEGAIPVIFSHDGAPDDIAAMVYLTNHPDLNVIGVIQSYGEQHPTRSVDEWQRFIYDVLDYRSILMGVGSPSPLDPAGNEFPDLWRSGADDFWGIALPSASSGYDRYSGVDLLIALILDSVEPVTLLVTGAQTDIALALQKDPAIKENIANIVIMGGAFNVPGNLGESPGNEENTVAEWNIFVDPLAAKVVFNAGIPLTVVSLDGSNDLLITQEGLALLADSTAPGADVLRALWEKSLGWSGGAFNVWDIVAAVAVTHPEYFTWEYDALDVIAQPGATHGQTVALGSGSEISRFSLSTDYDAVREAIFSILE